MKYAKTKITVLINNVSESPDLISEHGFSLLIECGDKKILFDCGQDGGVFKNNAESIGLNTQEIDTLILSHGHYDHTGGLPQLLASGGVVDLYAHPGVLVSRYSFRDRTAKPNGISAASCAAIQNLAGDCLHWTEKPVSVTECVGITGPVPRETDYEDTGGAFFLDKEGVIPDPVNDDQSMWIDTDEGLVVCAGCSHAGIVNTLHYIQRLNSDKRIRAVIGGLHLVNASQERIEKTIAALHQFNPDLIVSCHCTGVTAAEALRNSFGERVVFGAAGQIYLF